MTVQTEPLTGPCRPGFLARLLAVGGHLGYLPVGAALLCMIRYPSWARVGLVFCLAWTLLALLGFRWRPRSTFLRNHLQQAGRYHRFGMMALVSAAVGTVYLAVFTSGLGALLAVVVAPPLLLFWMRPTWAAAWDAVQGREHHYSAFGAMDSLIIPGERNRLTEDGQSQAQTRKAA